MQDLEHTLATHPFLNGLPMDRLEWLATLAEEVAYAPGEVIVREDEPAHEFVVILSGKVALEISAAGTDHTIQTLREGDVLGVSWLFPPFRWRFTARVLQPTRAVRFDGEVVRRRCDTDHELGYGLMYRFAAVLAGRLQAARLQLLDVYGAPTP